VEHAESMLQRLWKAVKMTQRAAAMGRSWAVAASARVEVLCSLSVVGSPRRSYRGTAARMYTWRAATPA
jgi:hypothetical protein